MSRCPRPSSCSRTARAAPGTRSTRTSRSPRGPGSASTSTGTGSGSRSPTAAWSSSGRARRSTPDRGVPVGRRLGRRGGDPAGQPVPEAGGVAQFLAGRLGEGGRGGGGQGGGQRLGAQGLDGAGHGPVRADAGRQADPQLDQGGPAQPPG